MGCSPWGQEESDTPERLHFIVKYNINKESYIHYIDCYKGLL